VVLLSSIDLVVNRRVWGSAVADVSALRHHGPALHHFYRLNRQYIGDPPDVAADGISLFISVAPSTPLPFAEQLCRDLAMARFDENAQPLGYTHVHVQSGPETFLADCDSP
jgi:hypothetical protein